MHNDVSKEVQETIIRNMIDALGESKEAFVNETEVTVASVIELATKCLELISENEKFRHKLQLISDYLNGFSTEHTKVQRGATDEY